MSDYVQRYWMGGAPQIWVVEAADYDKLAAELAEAKLFLADEKEVRRNAEAELAQAQARVTELSEMKPATMRQALLLLTNGMKYSTEVVTIAREALGEK